MIQLDDIFDHNINWAFKYQVHVYVKSFVMLNAITSTVVSNLSLFLVCLVERIQHYVDSRGTDHDDFAMMALLVQCRDI